MSVKSKQSSSRKEKSGKREKKKKLEDSDEDIESSEEELDLTKECHPIGYYMNDRAEMINQMFSVIKGNKLKAMLPPVLKEYDIEQLKLQCLDQLLGMSEKRITCILEGETLETSSESEVAESEEYDSDERNGTTSGSSSERSYNSQGGQANDVDSKLKKRKGALVNEVKGGKLPKANSDQPEQGKTLLEILELEMRARAIRALLKQSGNEKSNDPVVEDAKSGDDVRTNGVKEVTGEVVDLTECEDEELPASVKKEASEEADVDKKVSTFEEKIEKSKGEKVASSKEEGKSKRLQAELELRNKLFKKKIYRTRQQRMESEDDDKSAEKCEDDKLEEQVVVKQEPVEPVEPEEIFVEDPEEGEVSTSEEGYPVQIKVEVPEPEMPEEPDPEEELMPKMDEDAVRVTAIDNGTFVSDGNKETASEVAPVEAEPETTSRTEAPNVGEEAGSAENEIAVEETSWRDRWLQKDGVQKLVKSSKIYAKVKKRIAEKCLRSKEDVPPAYEASSDSNSNSKMEVIEGSIEEYERLLAKSKEHDPSENGSSRESAAPATSATPATPVPENEEATRKPGD